LLARYGIELIAERIETETTVVDLLDLHVRFGQGFLFSPPRPVRAEVFGAVPAPTLSANERVEPQLPRPPRRRETEYPQAPAAPMRTPTGIGQIARDMVRRA
jgi:cyclic-di-GMP phosphodiesterase TipF (flagellum assembly factor)